MLSLQVRLQASIERPVVHALLRRRFIRDFLARKRSTPIDGNVVDPDLAAILRLDDVVGGGDLRRLPTAVARARTAGHVLACEAPPPPGVDTRQIAIPGPAGNVPARLYAPRGLVRPSPGILFVHGGGFVTCDLDTHDALCRRLAIGARARLLAVDYRLAPEHRHPAAVDDTLAAFRWFAKNASDLGVDPARLAVTGDSAGGNLSAVLARRTRGDDVRPILHAPIYPATDARCGHPSHRTFAEGWLLSEAMIDWYFDEYTGADPARRTDPDVSPLLAPDLGGLPPAIVYTAGFDPLRDEGADYARRLELAGGRARHVCFGDMIHGFALLTGVSRAAAAAVDRIAADIGEALAVRRANVTVPARAPSPRP